MGFDLSGKTAGIVGTGNIGRATGQIFRGFGMKVLAYDPFPNHEWAKQNGVQYAEAASVLLRHSDVISLLAHARNQVHYSCGDDQGDEPW